MKSALAILSLFMISIVAKCQSEFQPGYVVNYNHDTLRGYLESSTESNLFKKVKFKSELNGSPKVFSKTDIVSFFFSGDLFRTVAFLNTSKENPEKDSSFAKQLVTGAFELYTFVDAERRFYIAKRDTSTVLLYDAAYGSANEPVQPGNYMSRLILMASECKSIVSSSQVVGFSQHDIAGFFVKLNNCVSPGSSKSLYQKPKIVTHVFAYAGLLPIGGNSQYTAEAGLRLSSPRISRNTFLNIGFHYSSTTTTGTALNGGNLPYKTTTIAKVYSLPVTFQYNFFNGRVRPYIYAGFSGSYLDSRTDGNSNVVFSGFQESFGLAFVAGASIEVRIVAGLSVRADYHYELITSQYPTFGLSYQF